VSLKKNILANYFAQAYIAVVGIVILPLYLKYMGAEAYGLVGFFTMLQAWFNLLDIGLTPTVARETARFHGGATSALNYRRLLRALQLIFIAVALIGGSAMFFCAELIAKRWLNVGTLPLTQVQVALELMAVGVALRWMSGLYRGCISGAERLVWLSGFNVFVTSLRFLGVLPVLIWVGHSPAVFFTYQLIVAIIEVTGLALKSRNLAPISKQNLGWMPAVLFAPIKSVLKFSLSIAFTSSVWVLVTQTDKLLLSKLLPLTDYGYFTLAVLAASGVMMISGPAGSALIPRLARLQAEGDEAALIHLYRKATKMVAAIAIPASLMLAMFAEQVLWIWTTDVQAAKHAAPTLRLYALGNGFLAMAAFPYYLQFAKGDMTMHLRGNAIFVAFLIPSLVWAVKAYGATGAGYVWVATNALYFFAWVPAIHYRFFKNLHRDWLLKDIGAISLASVVLVVLLEKFLTFSSERIYMLLEIIFISVTVVAANIAIASLTGLPSKK